MKEEIKKSKSSTMTQKSASIKSESNVEKKVVAKEQKISVKPAAAKKTTVQSTRKTLKGTIVSVKMQNTVVVAIERKVAHKLYGKLLRVTKRIKADTNGMEISEGDVVTIEQTRPISKDKNFKVIKKEEAK